MIVPIIMGSESDLDFAKRIGAKLKELEIKYEYRIASAHKAPEFLLEIIKEYDNQEQVVYITIAGRSNALSGFVSANSINPVIACPPLDKQSYLIDIHSSLRMPSNAPCMVVLSPKNAALAVAKILALSNSELRNKLSNNIIKVKQDMRKADEAVKNE